MSRGHQIPCKQKCYLTRFSVNLRMVWLLKMSLNKACLLGSENRNFYWCNFFVWGISAHSKTQDGDKKYLPYIDVNHPDISQKTTNPQTCVILDLQGTHPSKETNQCFQSLGHEFVQSSSITLIYFTSYGISPFQTCIRMIGATG